MDSLRGGLAEGNRISFFFTRWSLWSGGGGGAFQKKSSTGLVTKCFGGTVRGPLVLALGQPGPQGDAPPPLIGGTEPPRSSQLRAPHMRQPLFIPECHGTHDQRTRRMRVSARITDCRHLSAIKRTAIGPLFLKSNFYIICSLIFTNWHRFVVPEVVDSYFHRHGPPPPPPGSSTWRRQINVYPRTVCAQRWLPQKGKIQVKEDVQSRKHPTHCST